MARLNLKKNKKKVIKKASPQKLPKNYRFIPEKWNKDEVAFFAGAVFILLAILFVTYNLFFNLNEEADLANKKIQLTREELFWEEQIEEKPNFRDAYFSLALVKYQLNNLRGAHENLEKSLEIDPNFKEGKELQRILSGE